MQKHDFKTKINELSKKKAVRVIRAPFKAVWMLLGHNFRYKVLSLLIAVLLWNYVVANSTDSVRTKTLTGLTGYVSGQTSLTNQGLALADDPNEELSDITVVLEVGRGDFASVSADNVQVTLDLVSVRGEGSREVPLKATSSYGRVVRIVPETVTLTVEPLDSRVLPVNTELSGDQSDDMWYNVSRTNPSTLTVSGAASLVQAVDRVVVSPDVTDASASFTEAEDYTLLDSDGNEIPKSMITRSSSSVSVSVDVYPKKDIPVSDDVTVAVAGEPAEGYCVESVSIQPQSVKAAGEAELLDSVDTLYIEPVDVSGMSQSFSVRASVSALSAFKYVSADEVYVTVNIAEETASAWLEDVMVGFTGKGEGLILTRSEKAVRVYVTGPISQIREIKETGLAVTVDITGMEAGTHSAKMSFPTDIYPDVTFTPENEEIDFTLSEPEE